jgi:hypothetical protein
MAESILRKSKWTVLLPVGILFFLLAAGPVFADYSGHVASFKSEQNAIKFVHKMKAKGLVAYYEKEEVPGKGEFFRTYIGGFKTLPQARNTLTKMKKVGLIDYFNIQQTTGEKGKIAERKTATVAPKNEPVPKAENKVQNATQKSESAQKPENKTGATAQKSESVGQPENRAEASTQKNETVKEPESKIETVAQKNEPAQKPEIKTAAAAPKNESAHKPEKKIEVAAQKIKPEQEPENETERAIDTRHYYDGIAGIVLKNGKVVKGQIISIDDNDVLKIRTRSGKILFYSFSRDVREYIMENESE